MKNLLILTLLLLPCFFLNAQEDSTFKKNHLKPRIYLGYEIPVVGKNILFQGSIPLGSKFSIGGGIKFHLNNEPNNYNNVSGKLVEIFYANKHQRLGPQLNLRYLFSKKKIFNSSFEPQGFFEIGYWCYDFAHIEPGDSKNIVVYNANAPVLDLNLGIEFNIDIGNYFFLSFVPGWSASRIIIPTNEITGGNADFFFRVSLFKEL